jgi:hypothetical protein
VAVECHGFAVDLHSRVAFHDHAVMMAGHRTGATVADAGHGPFHHQRFFLPGHDFATVAGGVPQTNHPAHRVALI